MREESSLSVLVLLCSVIKDLYFNGESILLVFGLSISTPTDSLGADLNAITHLENSVEPSLVVSYSHNLLPSLFLLLFFLVSWS